MAGKGPKGTFKDPFSKWDDAPSSPSSPPRSSKDLFTQAKHQSTQVSAHEARIRSIQSSMRTATGGEAAALRVLLRETIKDLQQARTLERRAASGDEVAGLRRDTAARLAALKSWMAENQLTKEQAQSATLLQGRLENTLSALSKSGLTHAKVDKLADILGHLSSRQTLLSPELDDYVRRNSDTLNEVKDKQDEARKFLQEHSAVLKDFRHRMYSAMGSLTMRLASRIGVGAFNLGNVLRGVGIAGRGLASTARFGARLYRGETYGQRYLRARSMTSETTDNLSDGLLDRLKDSLTQTSWFQKKTLRELERQGRDVKRSQSEKGSLLGNVVETLTKTFGGGGFLRTIAGIIGPAVAAGLAAWAGSALGKAVYNKFAPQIQDRIEEVATGAKEAGSFLGRYWDHTKKFWTTPFSESKKAPAPPSAATSKAVRPPGMSLGDWLTAPTPITPRKATPAVSASPTVGPPSVQESLATDYKAATGKTLTILPVRSRTSTDVVSVPPAQAIELDKLGLLSKHGLQNADGRLRRAVSRPSSKVSTSSSAAPAGLGAVTTDTIAAPVYQAAPQGAAATMGPQSKATSNSSPSLADIPTIESTDGVFVALNLGVIG